MAGPKKTREIVDIDTLPPGYSDPASALAGLPAVHQNLGGYDDDEEDDVTSLNKVLDELGSEGSEGGFVTVFREMPTRTGAKREDEYIDRFDAGEFTLAELKDKCGPGRYKISVYRPGGKGLATRKTINIAGSPLPASVPVTASSGNSDIQALVGVMVNGFENLGKLIVASRPAETSRSDMLKELVVMKDLFSPGGGQQQPQQNYNPVEMMRLGMEMAQGGGESNNTWVDKMINTLSPLLMGAVAAGQAAPVRVAAPVRPTLSAPVQQHEPAPANPAPVNPPAGEEEPMNMMLKAYLKMMLSAAAQNAPVEGYADQVINLLSDEQMVEVETMLRADDWLARLTNLVPQAPSHAEWFTRLRNTILQYLDEDRAVASTVLTPGISGVSVHSHENGNTLQPGTDPLNPASTS
ncbi:MAG TPA: hypothetical protein VIY48_00240 [Candidatus Paceibacterota bacterium]